jgi:GH25 family lysozyme M1 (1,4-beta-N-acetylmuramidase)
MTLAGIDVSNWQGRIDWARVRAAGKSFAWCKASEGTGYADPTYAANRSHARGAGLLVGAYHFAQPSPGSGAAQADWLLECAAVAPGDLWPALDLEVSNGLSPSQMAAWVADFTSRVHAVLGVWPFIYASPSFWSSKVGNSQSAAKSGCPLWIAHWTSAPAPSVPASNWAGHGWTAWQWTSSGSVPGISGRVDLDRAIPSLSGLVIKGDTVGITLNLDVTHDTNPFDALGTAKVNGAGKSVTKVADGSKVAVAAGLALGVVQKGTQGSTPIVALNFGSPGELAFMALSDVVYTPLATPAPADCSAQVASAVAIQKAADDAAAAQALAAAQAQADAEQTQAVTLARQAEWDAWQAGLGIPSRPE